MPGKSPSLKSSTENSVESSGIALRRFAHLAVGDETPSKRDFDAEFPCALQKFSGGEVEAESEVFDVPSSVDAFRGSCTLHILGDD